MEIYLFMLFWVIIGGFLSKITSKDICVSEGIYEERPNIIIAFLTFSIIIFFASYRTNVADTRTYIESFQNLQRVGKNTRGPGFEYISLLVKTYISDNPTVWLSIIAIITGIAIMYTLYKYSCSYGLSMFLFMVTCQFTWMFNGMRQFLAAAILFSCTKLILENRLIEYMIIVLIMSTIHQSALILIPVYFIVKGEPWDKMSMLFLFVIILIAIFTEPFLDLLYGAVENTNYQTSMYEFRETDDGTNIVRVLVESVPTIIAFLYRNKIKDIATPVIKLSINMSFISSGLYMISKIARSGIMLGRMPIYFSLYNLILLPWLVKNVFDDKNDRRLIYFLMVFFYLLFFYYQMCIAWGGLSYGSSVLNIWY